MAKAVLTIIAFLFVIAFDHAMRADRDNLCGNDATAYEECSE